MKEVLEECATRFDWVLIDTSPVGVLPDAQVLGRLVGGVIFVIGAGSTPAAAVARAIAHGEQLTYAIVLFVSVPTKSSGLMARGERPDRHKSVLLVDDDLDVRDAKAEAVGTIRFTNLVYRPALAS